jgi:uncharacterized membrane protein YkvA (DUF1232 family)
VATAVHSRVLRAALERAAARLAGSPRLARLLGAAGAAVGVRGRGLGGVTRDVAALARMVRESVAGRYRRLPVRSLLAIVAAILYFLDPIDLIPDFIPVIGFADDAVVLLWVLGRVRRDLDAFLEWEAGRGDAIDVEAVAGTSAAGTIAPPALPHS